MNQNNDFKKFKITDCLCFIIFIIFIVFNIYVIRYGYEKGDIKKLFKFQDKNNEICGQNEAINKPYLLINDFLTFEKKNAICVKTCPGSIKNSFEDFKLLDNFNTKFSFVKICIPNIGINNLLYNKPNPQIYFKVILDTIINHEKQIYFSIIISLILTLITIILLRIFKKIIICFIVIASLAFLIFFSIYLFKLSKFYYNYNDKNIKIKNKVDNKIVSKIEDKIDGTIIKFDETIKNILKNTKINHSKYLKYLSIFIFIFTMILLLIIIFSIKNIILCSKVFSLVFGYFLDVKRIILYKIILNIILVSITIFNIFILIKLLTIGKVKPSDKIFPNFIRTEIVKVYIICFSIYLVWIYFFIKEVISYIVIFSIVEWSKNKSSFLFNSLCGSLFYNAGSLAFASLILLIIFYLKLAFKIFILLLKSSNPDKNIIIRIFDKIGSYYWNMLDRFIKYLNKLSYCEIIVEQKSFCSSSYTTGKILISNGLTFGILNFFSYVFKIFFFVYIIGLTFLLNYIAKYYMIIDFNIILFILISVFSYLNSLIFFDIFSIGSSTILYLFLKFENYQINNTLTTQKIKLIMNNNKDKTKKNLI